MTMATLIDYIKGAETELDEQEFRAKKSANVILWLIAGVFVVFLIWATFTQLDRTVRGVGRVVPSSKLQVVSNLEGGVVEQILIKPGQIVHKGDVLIRLSPKLSGGALGSSTATVDALEAKVARLNAEVRGGTPTYGGASGNQVEVERSLHAARAAELQGILSAGTARMNQAQSMLAARKSNLDAAQRELDVLRPLAAKQIVSNVDLIKAENAVAVASSEVAAALSAVAEARASMAQARSDWMSRAGVELSQAQAELSAQRQTLPALSDRVDRTVIRAPLSGKVNRVLVTTVGGSVSAGMPVAEIVPSDDTLYIEALVRPSDIAAVRLGQPARVEITAYNSAIFGTLDGRVTSISPDALINEKSGESFYTVEVQTVSKLRDHDNKELAIGPGMMANVNLIGEKRSVLSYLFTPITRLTEKAFRE